MYSVHVHVDVETKVQENSAQLHTIVISLYMHSKKWQHVRWNNSQDVWQGTISLWSVATGFLSNIDN